MSEGVRQTERTAWKLTGKGIELGVFRGCGGSQTGYHRTVMKEKACEKGDKDAKDDNGV